MTSRHASIEEYFQRIASSTTISWASPQRRSALSPSSRAFLFRLVSMDALDSCALTCLFERVKEKGKTKAKVWWRTGGRRWIVDGEFSKPEVASYMLKGSKMQTTFWFAIPLALATPAPAVLPLISFWNEWLEAFDQGFKDRWSRMQFTIPSRAAALYLELYMLRDFLPLYFGTPSQSTILLCKRGLRSSIPGSSLDCPLCVTSSTGSTLLVHSLPRTERPESESESSEEDYEAYADDFIHYSDDEDRDDYDSYLYGEDASIFILLHTAECYESVPAPLDVPVYQNPNSALSRAVRRLLLKMSCNTDNIECRNNTFGQRCPYCVVGNFPCSFNNLDFWEGFLVTFQQHFIRNWLQNNYTSPPIAAALFMELQILKDFVPLYIGSLTPDVILGVGARAANFHIVDTRLLRPVQDVIRGVIPPDSTFAVGLVSLLRSLCIPRLIGRWKAIMELRCPAQEAAEAWDDADLYNAE
ncbi:hypothetical protein B0H12DRAFT_1077281 [Mycena haematopus]|nr:hypothetical protein B0H12DRAFT_1077281 [Mycena haematopus]